LPASGVFAQTHLAGTVRDKNTGSSISSTTVLIPGTAEGTYTDTRGNFNMTTHHPLPFSLVFSAIGYRSDTLQVTAASDGLEITLSPTRVLGREIVVAASRVPENILTSPVSIEHIGLQEINQAPAADFYDLIGHVKGVDMVTSGLLFSTPTTRGFAGSGNVGLNQFVDGMDNQAPGLNFSVGNVVGLSELDIANIELLPGAASALYGAGGTNGTLLLTSKDPFQYQGLSALVKGGVMHLNDPQHKATPYQQYAVRYAKAFNNKFAFKVNADYTKAYDWIASDYSDYDKTHFTVKAGDRRSDPAYNGVNVYGDESSANILDIAQGLAQAGAIPPAAVGLVPNQVVTRTGYDEKDLVDYNTFNLKLGGTLAYKITPGIKATLEAHWGQGTTVYTGTDRYSLKKFNIGQYKLQLDGKHFMLRAYTTQEDAGDAYNATALGQLMNEGWKPSYDPANPTGSWFIQYTSAFLLAKGMGSTDEKAHQSARAFADNGMPQPGTARFNRLKDSVSRISIPKGALFTDKSSLYHYDGLYDFTGQIPFVSLQIGGSYRSYRLNSDGTIFDDKNKKITIGQWGLFAQAAKKLLHDRVKLTGAIRYDKNDNFEGKWTPRIAAVFTVAPENNIRVSYQTGYQLPTNQDQYIDLLVQQGRLIGGLPAMIAKYNLNGNPGFLVPVVEAYGDKYLQEYAANLQAGDGDGVASYKAAVAAETTLKDDKGNYQLYRFKPLKPESVHSFEVGYRGIIGKKLMLDAYVYSSNYTDKLVSIFVVQPAGGAQPIQGTGDPNKYYGPQLINGSANNYQTRVNSEGDIKTWGWALGGDYLLPKNFRLSANVSYNKMSHVPDDVFAQFNTPDYRVNVGIGNPDLYKGFGFQVNYRYQDAFNYEGSFAIGPIPAVNTVDAQVNYKIPKYKLMLKLGGTNILNHYYRNAFGNPMIGGLYYLSVGYNVW
jgi:outer membrane receptor protein involved in Fe transport